MKLDILEQNNNFLLYGNCNKCINNQSLFQLYLPIIGHNALHLYTYLWNIKEIENSTKLRQINDFKILSQRINFDINELIECINYLESVKLIKTYVNINEQKIILDLIHPLSYFEFINNEKLKYFLINKIGDVNFKNLEYIFNYEIIPNGYIDISNDYKFLYEKNNENNCLDDFLNWNKIQSKLLCDFKKKIKFLNNDKQKISIFYNDGLLNESNLYHAINNSLIKKNDEYFINNNLLINYVDNIKIQNDFISKNKINRSYQIFELNSDLSKFNSIIDDYCKYESEKYLLIITKNDIKHDVLYIIKQIKQKFELKDEYINIVIDYSIYKNFGRIVPNYIYKLCETINNLCLNNVIEIITYFRNVNNGFNYKNNIYKKTSDDEIVIIE